MSWVLSTVPEHSKCSIILEYYDDENDDDDISHIFV